MSSAKELFFEVAKVRSFTFKNAQEKAVFIMSLKMFIKRVFIHDKSFFEIFNSLVGLDINFQKFVRSFGRFNTIRLFAILFCIHCKKNNTTPKHRKFDKIVSEVYDLIFKDPFIDVFSDMTDKDKKHIVALSCLFINRKDYECSYDDVIFVSTLF